MRCSRAGRSATGQRCGRCWISLRRRARAASPGYGLGIEKYALPGGIELIGHLGGAPGYRSFVGRVRPLGVTMTLAMNAQDDPTPLLLPAIEALSATRR